MVPISFGENTIFDTAITGITGINVTCDTGRDVTCMVPAATEMVAVVGATVDVVRHIGGVDVKVSIHP